MWPKNSCGLQLRVIVCVILLVAVRVINVIVPLLTKDISKYISQKRMALLEPYNCILWSIVTYFGCIYIIYVLSVDKLAGNTGKTGPVFCWDLILIYVSIKWLQGGGTGSQGLLNIMRQFLWIKIQQYTTREIQVKIIFSSSDLISLDEFKTILLEV